MVLSHQNLSAAPSSVLQKGFENRRGINRAQGWPASRLYLLSVTNTRRTHRQSSRCAAVRSDIEEFWSDDVDETSWGCSTVEDDTLDDDVAVLSDEALLELEPGGPVASAQNMLGLGLFLVLALGCGNILLKALVVTWSIFAAAIQYSFVGLLFIVIIIFVTP